MSVAVACVLLVSGFVSSWTRSARPLGVRHSARGPVLRASPAKADIYGRIAQADAASSSSEPVVKVYSVHSSVNVQMPWTTKPQEESTGSGFTIEHEGRLVILTNAHVVADATYVEVRKAGDAQKYVAEVERLSHECDLATLRVIDESFWEGVAPLAFGRMPSLQDEVSVVGYPEGGEGISVTQARTHLARHTRRSSCPANTCLMMAIAW
jgi:S1-C subfamily serine protease